MKHYQRVIKFGDPNAVKWEMGKNITLTTALKDYIDGLLLGDGSIIIHEGPRRTTSRLAIAQCTRRREWIDCIEKYLLSFGIHGHTHYVPPKPFLRIAGRPAMGTGQYFFQSHHYPLFNQFRERWYQSKKKLPNDLVINPITVANWYLGDGTFFPEKRHARVKLCTCSKSEEEIAFLIEHLKNNIGISHIREHQKCIIILSQEDVLKFINYIPTDLRPACFDYKFQWSR
jgi:hypothetical protein